MQIGNVRKSKNHKININMKKTIITLMLASAAIATAQAQGLVFFQNNSSAKIETNTATGGSGTGTQVTTPNGANVVSGAGNYYFALFYSTTQTSVGGTTNGMIGANVAVSGGATVGTNTVSGSLASYVFNAAGWSNAGLIGTNSGASAGRFASSAVDGLNQSTVTGLGAGAAANFVIVGWSANIGNTIGALMTWYNAGNPLTTGWIGESQVTGSIVSGNGGGIPTPGVMGGTFSASTPVSPTFTLGEILAPAAAPEPGTMALCALGGASLLMFRRKK